MRYVGCRCSRILRAGRESHTGWRRLSVERALEFRQRLRRRDPAAWNQLSEQYCESLLRSAGRLLPRGADAEAVVSEVFYLALRAAKRYDTERSPYPWLSKICFNTCMRYRRDRDPAGPLLDGGAERAIQADDPVAKEECIRAVRAALPSLGRREFQVVTLRFHFRLSSREIAQVLRLQERSVRQALTRALARLRTGPHAKELRRWMS